ncbi:N-acetyltransferase [Paenibacillus alvei]|uniref:N-acetyltransferase n=1 Tax=Paenibacillus alvei TaxID=44250 RepID=A0ABT4GXC5_PAEAL|nr:MULTISPECIES: N-acetyltransferase [Paenibacillus]EJW19635.1 putative N-acetyltransferase YesJ [Paenibacillus alvei DSM 29]MCY7485047.1 N-acetyltransferase [Paenibacillus alvei]MCY9541451.1 N-acetyltransferase [Paenibacillus alvei]MCY9702642.1 N-acetyltransferase [Paenibacillus alvei]MCY9733024.1 N-acetyltransferase [Paenibacillus alvei]
MNEGIIQQKTLPNGLIAVRALSTDTEHVMALLHNTAKWLQERGSTQWNALLQGQDTHNTADAILNGDVFLFKQEGQIAGMVILLTTPSPWDRLLWGNDSVEESVYVHRLAINRNYAGQHVGSGILAWTASGIAFPNKRSIRLDCMSGIPALESFYRGAGFAYQGRTDNGYLLFEKNLALFPPVNQS